MAVDIIDLDSAETTTHQTAAAPAQQIDPAELAKEILARMPKPTQQQQFPTPIQKNKVATVIEDMLAEGFDPKAVQKILNLYAAGEQEKAEKDKEIRTQQNLNDFNNRCWGMADEALGKFEAALPAIRDEDCRLALLQKTNKIFQTNAIFAADREAGQNSLKLPSRNSINTAAAMAIEAYCKANGIKNTVPGLDTKSSPIEAPGAKSDPYDGLSDAGRKRARAIVAHLKLTPAEAAKRVARDKD